MYEDYKPSPSGNLAKLLESLALELEEASEEVRRKEEELAQAKERLRDIAENKIPEATDGMEGDFILSDGRRLITKEMVRASIAGDKRVPAINWLDKHGFGHIVRRQLIFDFAKGDVERFNSFREKIESLNIPLVVEEKFTVHHRTLEAWVKECLSEGVDIPFDTFGVHRQRVAKLKE